MRRVVATVSVVMLLTAGWSYYRALSAPGTDPLGARSVEWLRDHGMSGAVDWVEHWWYTNHPPPVGGVPAHGLPRSARLRGVAVPRHRNSASPAAYLRRPVNMVPLVTTPLPGEGVWRPTGRRVAGHPAVYSAYFRPDAIHTSLVAGALWLDTKLLNVVYVPGLREPPFTPHPWGAQVPPLLRGALVAAFNSGFKLTAAQGGVFIDGKTVFPLVNGAASLVIDSHGKASVGQWGRDVKMSPNIATVRQNLALIVDHVQPVPGLPTNVNGAWGATLGNKVFVWRSGVGVDAHGALVYVAGPGLSAVTLATLLQRAGCIRAMELDINADWVSAYVYQADPTNPGVIHGVKLLQDMTRNNDRYLVPGERDFFAVLASR
jgi:hypothetical protein